MTIFKTGITTGIADIHEYLSAITYEWELINLTNRNDILKNYMKFVYGSLSMVFRFQQLHQDLEAKIFLVHIMIPLLGRWKIDLF